MARQVNNKIQHNKKALVMALESSLGVVTDACKAAGLDRSTFYKYYNEDEEFKNEVDSIKDIAIDLAESKLLKQIEEGNTTAIIFYLKTQGKKRGYVERSEHDHTTKGESLKEKRITFSDGSIRDENGNIVALPPSLQSTD